MSSRENLNNEMLQKTSVLGLKRWVLVGVCVGVFTVSILVFMVLWVTLRRRTRRPRDKFRHSRIPIVSKEITVDRVVNHSLAQNFRDHERGYIAPHDKSSDKDPKKTLAYLTMSRSSNMDNMSQSSSHYHNDRGGSSYSGDEGSSGHASRQRSTYKTVSASPLVGLPEFSHLGWGHWFTLRDLEFATNWFCKENVLGEGGYGIVYRGRLINGTEVAVKKILNNMGQAEREFRVEVEAIGHVRHKNLVRLLGYCVEGIHRMLVYEYVNNGNLEQWLHGAMRQHGCLSWDARMKVITGTAKALSYLHEAIEPKVVHRDIKSSNILIDHEFNAKVSDFGLAKLLGTGKSHIATRVMGTFGYVAPEYANTGLLNEKSDIYSFGVLLVGTVTGRDPVDYSRPSNEVYLVEWLKYMVGCRQAEEVVDPNLDEKPSIRSLKRALLIALRCLDLDSDKRPKMGQVVRMLEADDLPHHEDRRRRRRSQSGNVEVESIKDYSSSTDVESSEEIR